MNKEQEKLYWPRVVREAQKFGHLTLQAIANYLGVTSRDVSHWKSGRSRPTGMVAVKLYEWRCTLMSGTVVHSQQTGKRAMS